MLPAAVVWTLLLIGLFVMHGASSHGTAPHASSPAATGAADMWLGLAAGHSGHAGHEGVAVNGDSVQHSESDEGESPWHSGAELCLALLSALAVLLALTRPERQLFEVRRAVTPLDPPWLRPSGPPCLIRLSILRC